MRIDNPTSFRNTVSPGIQDAPIVQKHDHAEHNGGLVLKIDTAILDRVEFLIEQVEAKHVKMTQLEQALKKINLTKYDMEQKRLVVLNAGSSFGEQALLDEKKGERKARITCLENCSFAVMHVCDYNESLKKIEKRQNAAKLEFFLSMPYF